MTFTLLTLLSLYVTVVLGGLLHLRNLSILSTLEWFLLGMLVGYDLLVLGSRHSGVDLVVLILWWTCLISLLVCSNEHTDES